MPSATRRSIQSTIDQLDGQRRRYELAISGASSTRARDRYRRNVARLDDEIAAHREALASLTSSSDAMIPSLARPSLESELPDAMLSGPWARLELDGELGVDRGQMWRLVALAFVVGFLVVGFGVLVATA